MSGLVVTEDVELMRLGYDTVKEYISYVPNTEVFKAQITVVNKDTAYAGIYSIEYDEPDLGAYTDLIVGMNCWIGTEPDTKDIGCVRLREAVSSTVLDLDWTSDVVIDIEVGYYITIVDDYRPFPQLINRIDTSDGSNLSFVEYHNYDEFYTDQNDNMPPICNVTGVDLYITFGPKFAGFCDPGETTRQVDLTMFLSQQLTGGSIASYLWDISDGSFVGGTSSTDVFISATFPVGFRWIHCSCTNTNGKTSTRHVPIWVHDKDTYPPVTKFQVTRDTTAEYRTMNFKFFGADSEWSKEVLPHFCTTCYWEIATFGRTAESAPHFYRRSFIGWISEETIELKRGVGTYEIVVNDIGGWLDKFMGFGQLLMSVADPSFWYQFTNLNHAKAAFWLINSTTWCLPLINLFPVSLNYVMKEIELQEGTVWRQLTQLYQRIFNIVKVDTYNQILVEKQFHYRTPAERLNMLLIKFEPQDWAFDDPPVIRLIQADQMSSVSGQGSAFYGSYDPDHLIIRASHAPSLLFGRGSRVETAPFQDLPNSDSQVELNWLTGQHYARLNANIQEVSLKIIRNMDVVTPGAFPISIDYNLGNVRGMELSNKYLVVREVSIAHDYTTEHARKILTFSCEIATIGQYAATIPVVNQPTPEDNPGPEPIAVPVLRKLGQTIAAFHLDGYLSITENFLNTDPDWSSVDLGLGTGNMVYFEPDAFSPFYLGTGSNVDGWLFQNADDGKAKIYRITDIFGTPSGSVVFTSTDPGIWRGAKTERQTQNWVVGMFPASSGNALKTARTVNGTVWPEATILTAASGHFEAAGTELHVSPHQPGQSYAYVSDTDNLGGYIKKSSDYGATYSSAVNAAIPMGYGSDFLHVPYQSEDDGIIYMSNPTSLGYSRYESGIVVDYVVSFSSVVLTPIGNFGLKTCDIDKNSIAIAGGSRCGVSSDEGSTFIRVDGGTNDYIKCNFSGDDNGCTYWWGYSGAIGRRLNSGNIVDKSGSSSPIHSSDIINICGGPG